MQLGKKMLARTREEQVLHYFLQPFRNVASLLRKLRCQEANTCTELGLSEWLRSLKLSHCEAAAQHWCEE